MLSETIADRAMQALKKLNALLKTSYSRIWIGVLLFYSALMFILFLLGTAPLFLILPFYIFTPGYSIITISLPQVSIPEKVIGSMGFSLSFFVGLSGSFRVFNLVGLVSEDLILTTFSVACFAIKLVSRK